MFLVVVIIRHTKEEQRTLLKHPPQCTFKTYWVTGGLIATESPDPSFIFPNFNLLSNLCTILTSTEPCGNKYLSLIMCVVYFKPCMQSFSLSALVLSLEVDKKHPAHLQLSICMVKIKSSFTKTTSVSLLHDTSCNFLVFCDLFWTNTVLFNNAHWNTMKHFWVFLSSVALQTKPMPIIQILFYRIFTLCKTSGSIKSFIY